LRQRLPGPIGNFSGSSPWVRDRGLGVIAGRRAIAGEEAVVQRAEAIQRTLEGVIAKARKTLFAAEEKVGGWHTAPDAHFDDTQAGNPFDRTVALLSAWARRNHPANGKPIIRESEIRGQARWAYCGGYKGCGCEDPAVMPFCDPSCRLYQRVKA